MDDLDRPNLEPQADEEINVALHEIDKTHWARLRAMQMGPGPGPIIIWGAQPRPPKRPVQLRAILHSYAQALFPVEASKYPQDDSRLQHWRLKLTERISARVMQSVQEIESRGFWRMESLAYHGVTESQMRDTVDKALREITKSSLPPAISKQKKQPIKKLAPAESELQTSSASKDKEIERRRKLLEEYKAATGNPSSKKIYEAENCTIYKPQFYEWKNGKLLSNSTTAKSFEQFLRAKKPPQRKPD
jgi:hypothetical protein